MSAKQRLADDTLASARHDAPLRGGSASSMRVGKRVPRAALSAWAMFFSTASAGFGCAPAPEVGDAVASQEAAIIAGSATGSRRDAVVVLEVEGLGVCSGTLVRPNLVLTARHCVAESDHHVSCGADGSVLGGARVYADVSPSSVRVLVGSTWSELRGVASGVRLLHDGASNLCSHDIAFVLLDRAIADVSTAPLRLSPTQAGEQLTAVGWGLDAEGVLPEQRQERARVDVRAVAPSPGVAPRILLTGEATCQGDSGGPLLDASGAVVAVASYGGHSTSEPATSGCAGADMVNVFSLVAGYPALVREAVARADRAAADLAGAR